MKYKGYEIVGEVWGAMRIVSLDDNGCEAKTLEESTDCIQKIFYYGAQNKNGDVQEWADSIEDIKKWIDEQGN